MLLVTSIIAAVLTVIFIKLSFAVIGLRRKNKVGLGCGGQLRQLTDEEVTWLLLKAGG